VETNVPISSLIPGDKGEGPRHDLFGESNQVIGTALLEPEKMHDFGDSVAGLVQLLEGDFHHAGRRPSFNFFEEHNSCLVAQGEAQPAITPCLPVLWDPPRE
jgi:hypothetical protein